MRILHFGAGNIGRGLVLPYFKENYDMLLVDSNIELVRSIRMTNGYKIIELEYGRQKITEISNPPIITLDELTGLDNIDIITTSVIVNNLPQIAPYICKILNTNKRPVYIIPLENSLDSTSILKSEMSKYIEMSGIYFLRSVIDRLIPSNTNSTDIICEKYCSIIVEDAHNISNCGECKFVLTKDILREFDKKLLLVNGLHACAAYIGFLEGHEYICDVMNSVVRTQLEQISECYVQYLVNEHSFKESELISFLDNVFRRFSDPSIKDPLSRVGRNMSLKLSPTERIVRPLLSNKRNNLKYEPLLKVLDAAKHFVIANDYDKYLIERCDGLLR